MAFWSWSRTASSNSTADGTINWAEGQAPSSVNDSARAMMARTAEWRDDISGAITTGGASTAYTLTSYQVFDTLAHMSGQMIAFVPHATNTNAVGVDVTLNVDGLGAKSIRMQPSVALPNGTLVLGTPYVVTYNNSDSVFYLQNMTNPYLIPLGGGIDFWGATAPNSSFAFSYGQAISRTTYATLFTIVSTTYGTGDGSTTFNLPDMRGRIGVPADNMGGSQAFRINNILTNGLGSIGGEQQHTLTTAELPAHSHANTLSDPGHTHGLSVFNTVAGAGAGSATNGSLGTAITNSATTGITINNVNAGSGTTHNNVQPSIVCNYIIRII